MVHIKAEEDLVLVCITFEHWRCGLILIEAEGDRVYWLFIYAGVVERLKVIFDETKAPLNDDVSELPHFCVTLEGVLRHQQKGELP